MMQNTEFSASPQAAPTGRQHPSRVAHTLLAAGIGTAVALTAWYPGHYAIALLALPAAWSRLRSQLAAFMLWASYYLAGARDIPMVCARFFGGYDELTRPTALALGVVLWVLQAIVLASPWVLLKPGRSLYDRSPVWRVVVATLVVTVPPVGIIGWLSPLHVASMLYPGWRWVGMGLGMAALCAAAMPRAWPWTRVTWTALVCLSVCAHWQFVSAAPPAGWIAVDTALGRFDQSSYTPLYERNVRLQAIARRAFAAGNIVVILPEEIAGLWRTSTALWWRADIQRMRATGQTLVIGMDVAVKTVPFRYTDTAIITGAGHGRVNSRQPVPLALWRPGGATSAVPGSLAQPYPVIAGKRAAISLCYEDLLWWPHWRTLVEKPDVVISQSNGWFDGDLALSRIQQQGIVSVARLAGAPLLRATNR
ncbi:hypothetical protein SAMN05192563_1004329 [Paraburkholderia aspalathi]|uniref:Apolipoprotein N-acyltransferase n=1 Tax=Paraburkholderia aspalathi TaxID=1324617 RepID=A0A1I7BB60_9BURK|nr:hypothetical protein SAMN05192563_1004329 [Paraburkholderia aspalathi]